MALTIVGVLISIIGFISGIVAGDSSDNFGICLLVWLITFLFALIYFGFGYIIKRIDELTDKVDYYLSKKSAEGSITKTAPVTPVVISPAASVSTAAKGSSAGGAWTCPACGEKNSRVVTKCILCGKMKEQ